VAQIHQLVSEMLACSNYLMQLSAQEDVFEFCYHENFKTYKIVFSFCEYMYDVRIMQVKSVLNVV
jgi:hypothetical protein